MGHNFGHSNTYLPRLVNVGDCSKAVSILGSMGGIVPLQIMAEPSEIGGQGGTMGYVPLKILAAIGAKTWLSNDFQFLFAHLDF